MAKFLTARLHAANLCSLLSLFTLNSRICACSIMATAKETQLTIHYRLIMWPLCAIILSNLQRLWCRNQSQCISRLRMQKTCATAMLWMVLRRHVTHYATSARKIAVVHTAALSVVEQSTLYAVASSVAKKRRAMALMLFVLNAGLIKHKMNRTEHCGVLNRSSGCLCVASWTHTYIVYGVVAIYVHTYVCMRELACIRRRQCTYICM